MPRVTSDPAVQCLLTSREPGIRYQVLTQLLDLPSSDPEVVKTREEIVRGPKVAEIFGAQRPDGSWSDFAYRKWTGTHHVLRRLLDLAVPGDDERIRLALERDIEWLPDARRKGGGAGGLEVVEGRVRWHCGAFEGVTLCSWCGFGYARDARVRELVECILSWQWPDGGWNCDKRPHARNSSFIESIDAMRGLLAYHAATGDPDALAAAQAASEIFLRRGVLWSERSGRPIRQEWMRLQYPGMFNVLRVLHALLPLGLTDPRLSPALDLVERRRQKNGLWRATGPKPAVTRVGAGELVDWADGTRDEMVTLWALCVLRAAGRLGGQRDAHSYAHVQRWTGLR